MASFKNVIVKLNAWRRYREAVRELSKMNDHVIAHVAFWTLKRGMAEVGLAG